MWAELATYLTSQCLPLIQDVLDVRWPRILPLGFRFVSGATLAPDEAFERGIMMGQLRWDEAQWPVVIVHFPDGSVARPKMVEYFDHVETLLKRQEPFAVIVVHEKAGSGLDQESRAYAASMNNARGDALSTYLRAFALVSESVLARTALTAVNWLAPFPYPIKAFRSVAEAKEWVKTRFDKS